MDIKIDINSCTSYYGKQIYFSYRQKNKAPYICATITWEQRFDPYNLKIYKGFNTGSPLDNNYPHSEEPFIDFPCDIINNTIKDYLKERLNIQIDNIEYKYKNRITKLLKDYNSWIFSEKLKISHF